MAATPSKEPPKSAVVGTTTSATTTSNNVNNGRHTADFGDAAGGTVLAAELKDPPTRAPPATVAATRTTSLESPFHEELSTAAVVHAPSVDVGSEEQAQQEDHASETADSKGGQQQPPEEINVVPTYESTKDSDSYQAANALLKDGLYDDAIQVIEESLQQLNDTLITVHHLLADGHPSVAPYQYLYGTTLLYKIEDEEVEQGTFHTTNVPSTANDNDTARATTATTSAFASAGGVGGGGGGGGGGDEDNTYQQVGTGKEDGAGQEYENENDENEEEDVDDRQVAWECLEYARIALEKLLLQQQADEVVSCTTSSNNATTTVTALHSDLAQVRLRLGDLNKLNGVHAAAVVDYQESLKHLQSNPDTFSPYNRKVADLHFNIGQTLILQFAEAAAEAKGQEGEEEGVDATMETLTPAERSVLRSRAAYHLWQCSRGLAGYLATLCGIPDPQQFLDQIDQDTTSSTANLKSTGEEGEDDWQEHPTVVSQKLTQLREALADVLPTSSSISAAASASAASVPVIAQSDHEAEIEELMQLLEFIQETVDEAESDERGLQEVQHLKAEITAAASASAASASGPHENSIGGFGSTVAAASTAAAQPIIVKKKKKRDADEVGLPPKNQDSKRPAPE